VRNTFARTSASWRRAPVDSSLEAASPLPHADSATAATHAIPKSSAARTIEDLSSKTDAIDLQETHDSDGAFAVRSFWN
jgi:hypothetical protein